MKKETLKIIKRIILGILWGGYFGWFILSFTPLFNWQTAEQFFVLFVMFPLIPLMMDHAIEDICGDYVDKPQKQLEDFER